MSKQRLPQFVGVSSATAEATAISMNVVVIPAGGAAEPHVHKGYETAIYVLETGMSVHRVAALYTSGMNGEAIQSAYPHIPVGHVVAALAYYFANRPEIDGYLREDEEAYEQGARESRSRRMRSAG